MNEGDDELQVSETCQLAAARISWLHGDGRQTDNLPPSPYMSVDPAPPTVGKSVSSLKDILLDDNANLFERYRAMFALRNLNSPEAALALAEGRRDSCILNFTCS
jgi:deoxyhypusine monooxygenase